MKDAIVGWTGFVGSNIVAKHNFTNKYHSTDITEAYGTSPDLLVYAGMPAEMFLANHYPEKDYARCKEAMENIRRIQPKTVVLISTIAVYDEPFQVDEDSLIDERKLTVYGRNRRDLEKYVESEFSNHLVVRLPALFGNGIKKNFVYDMIHFIPSMLTDKKFNELSGKNDLIREYYFNQKNGFWKCRTLNQQETVLLKEYFHNIGYSALNFTDSRSVYQFYNLSYLWGHICKAIDLHIPLLNIATEPISCSDLYQEIYHSEFINELPDRKPYKYDFRTSYYKDFGGKNGYIFDHEQVVKDLREFINLEEMKQGGGA